MNPDFSDDMDLFQLERELQSLTPAAPRRELVKAIQARMEPVPRRVAPHRDKAVAFPWRRMVAPAAAAAAAVAVFNIDDERRDGKTAAAPDNENTAAINWEPMPMLPRYRALLNAGYQLTEDMQFVPPGLLGHYNAPVIQFAYPNDSALTSAPQRREHRFIMPASYEGHTNLRVH